MHGNTWTVGSKTYAIITTGYGAHVNKTCVYDGSLPGYYMCGWATGEEDWMNGESNVKPLGMKGNQFDGAVILDITNPLQIEEISK